MDCKISNNLKGVKIVNVRIFVEILESEKTSDFRIARRNQENTGENPTAQELDKSHLLLLKTSYEQMLLTPLYQRDALINRLTTRALELRPNLKSASLANQAKPAQPST